MKQVFPTTLQSGMSQSGSYILMLREPVSGLEVPVFIGAYEAQGILLAKDNIATRRPMTHQLVTTIMDEYGLTVKQVTIDRVEDGIFYATLYVGDGFGEKRFDSRTSDAVTLALLCGCPILMEESVIEETGMKSEKGEVNVEELEKELRRCEENEEYERAAEIQKQIEKLRGEK
ncbi:MAG: bifunctional nuclease domain-containing protein [bacterium]